MAAASFLSDAASSALRVAIGRAMQQQVPAFFLHGLTVSPALNRVFDAAVGVLIDIALWAAFVVLLAVLLLVLLATCVVAALVAVIVHLDRARASRSRVLRLAVLSFVPLFLLAVAVVLMLVVILAIVDATKLTSEE